MDNLDKISIVAVLILVVSIVFIATDYDGEAGHIQGAAEVPVERAYTLEIPGTQVKIMKDFIANNNISKAESMLDELKTKYPYDGEPYMLEGDIMLRKQDPVAAMSAFRTAVDLNPDYVDKKTDRFQGKKIRTTLTEVNALIEKKMDVGTADNETLKARKTMYYLLRKLAGSCG